MSNSSIGTLSAVVAGRPGAHRWRIVGRYDLPSVGPSWARSHAQCPTAIRLTSDLVRVFIATRDADQIPRIGFVDAYFEAGKFKEFSALSSLPSLSTGGIGTFDEHGVYPSTVLMHEGKYLLFYAGYSRGAERPLFYTSIGLATSDDCTTFTRQSQAPILSRSEFDPCLVTSPAIYRFGEQWIMYYVSGFEWFRAATGRLQSKYDIKIARSDDLMHWTRHGDQAIGLDAETNISRATVVAHKGGGMSMWYCRADESTGYQLGYATSADGARWTRRDDLTGLAQGSALDTRMQAYPHVFGMNEKAFLLLNGENYGSAGFLIAEMMDHD